MLEVAVGVIKNQVGDVLISQRVSNAHQASLWEFPGGKLELGEAALQALKRELLEELNIKVVSAKLLIKVQHRYEDLSVCLFVYTIDTYLGEVRGMQKQVTKWVSISTLRDYSFPEANKKIIEVLNLPRFYPIVDESLGDDGTLLKQLDKLTNQGYKMIQLRAKSKNEKQLKSLALQAIEKCKKKGVRLFLNSRVDIAKTLKADGVHLSGRELDKLEHPLGNEILLAASCHTQFELKKASDLGALFTVLSPVCYSRSHIDIEPLGWESFSEMARQTTLPVFALGGVGPENLEQAIASGAFGVSGIRDF